MQTIFTTSVASGISYTALKGITLMMLLMKVLAEDFGGALVTDTLAPPASTCRPDIQCAQPMELYEEGLFKRRPSIVTKNNTKTVTTTHTTTHRTFKPVFTVTTEATLGVCEKFDPIFIDKERPTVTVWVDVTSTQHYFTSTVVEKEVSFTYTTTATDPCVREIDRPKKYWLGGIPTWELQDDEDDDDDNDEEAEIKQPEDEIRRERNEQYVNKKGKKQDIKAREEQNIKQGEDQDINAGDKQRVET